MKNFLLATLSALATAGCSPTTYSKPNGSTEEFERAMADCRAKGAMMPAQEVALGGRPAFIEQCIRTQGWTAK